MGDYYILFQDLNIKPMLSFQSNQGLGLLFFIIIFCSMKQATNERSASKRLWNSEEDELLRKIVGRHGELKWSAISDDFNCQIGKRVMRTNKQCRQRWQNHLNPVLRNNSQWRQEQHEALFTLFREYSHQWCKISVKLQEGGFARRGDNHIKNYFYSSIKRAIKKINEVVRESNKEIKKKKSLFYNYSEKYTYKKRLSLQRQILTTSVLNSDSTSNQNIQILSQKLPSNSLRIIKELDQQIVSKILLIAELKGAKKFTISNKAYEQQAISTRNKLINYIKDNCSFQPEDVIQLVTQILELSRKCKRKNFKVIQAEDNQMSPEEDIKSIEIQNSIHEEPMEQQDKQKIITPVAQQQKSSSSSLLPQRKNIQEQKKLLQRFLCEEEDPKSFAEAHKKICSSSEYNSSSKLADQAQNSACSFYPFNQQMPKICLDQSNSYFYGSNCLSQRDNLLFAYDSSHFPLNIDQKLNPNTYNSLAYQDAFDSQNLRIFNPMLNSEFELLKSDSAKRISRMREGQQQVHTNLAEFNFINTIKEIQPMQGFTNEQIFDFDINTHGVNVNPFTPGFFRSDSEQDRLFSSQLQLLSKPSSHRSNKSQIRITRNDLEREFETGQNPLEPFGQSQHLLNRSWAYSSSRLDQCRNLCNSNNYQASRKNNFTVDLKNSNFYPFVQNQQ